MATNKQPDNNQHSSDSEVEIERTSRLRLHGLVFEEITVNETDQGTIKLTGANINDCNLTNEDVGNLVKFFASFQRRSRNKARNNPQPRNQAQDNHQGGQA